MLLGQARPLAREALAALHAAQQRQKALLEAKLEATVRICKVASRDCVNGKGQIGRSLSCYSIIITYHYQVSCHDFVYFSTVLH